MARALTEIEADLRRAEVDLQVSKASFQAYMFGVLVGLACGFCLGILFWHFWMSLIMPRAAKRQSEIDRLKAEVNDLRKAGQQLMAGVTEFARQENWKLEGTLTDDGTALDRWVWKEGDPIKVARKYLGLEESNN